MCYHADMKAAALEPGLLPTFRGLMLLELCVTLLGAFMGEQGKPVHLPAVVMGVGILSVGLLVYLSWPGLQHRLGSAYLPVAIIIAAALPIIEQYLFLQSQPMSDIDSLHANDWQTVLFLSFPLLIVSWQYSFHSVIVFCLGTGLFDLISIALAHAQFDAIARQEYFHTLATRTAVFLLAGHTISHLKTQRALEQANHQLHHYATTLEQLAVSRERNRVARELHDTLAHTLSGTALELEAVKTLWDVDQAKARALLDRALSAVRDGLIETRRALQALRAAPLEDLGLSLAVRELAEATAAQIGATLCWQGKAQLDRMPAATEQCVYRVAQEALENIARHAEAQQISVNLSRNDHQLNLEVSDNGHGFDLSAIDADRHFGLKGMRERAEMVGGHLEIESQLTRGTTIRLSVELGNDSRSHL
jgi:signal transduction histidine kinase